MRIVSEQEVNRIHQVLVLVLVLKHLFSSPSDPRHSLCMGRQWEGSGNSEQEVNRINQVLVVVLVVKHLFSACAILIIVCAWGGSGPWSHGCERVHTRTLRGAVGDPAPDGLRRTAASEGDQE